jgi:hypothetical protein
MHTAGIKGALDLNQMHLGAILPEEGGTLVALMKINAGSRAST